MRRSTPRRTAPGSTSWPPDPFAFRAGRYPTGSDRRRQSRLDRRVRRHDDHGPRLIVREVGRDGAAQPLLQRPLDASPPRADDDEAGIELRIPPLRLCTDNGAMIAALGAQLVMAGRSPSRLDFAADSTLPATVVQS